jgi:hypothetical protein
MASISISATQEQVQRFLDILDRGASATPISTTVPEAPKAPEPSKPEAVADTDGKKEAQPSGSVAKYKKVDEMYSQTKMRYVKLMFHFCSWDAAYKYKILDSSESTSKEQDPVEYVFIVRRRFGKHLPSFSWS